MNQHRDIESRVRGYLRREVLPSLPEEIQFVSFEIVSWHICVHTYQQAVLEDGPFEVLEPRVVALAKELPARDGEQWRSTLTSHRFDGESLPKVEGTLVYERCAEV